MEIFFARKKLHKECNDSRLLIKRYGERTAPLIRRRLDELRAAETLDVLRTLRQVRCHELTGDRKGQIAVDLDHPRRLVFRPCEPVQRKPDGGLDWKRTTAVEIVDVVDYHG